MINIAQHSTAQCTSIEHNNNTTAVQYTLTQSAKQNATYATVQEKAQCTNTKHTTIFKIRLVWQQSAVNEYHVHFIC